MQIKFQYSSPIFVINNCFNRFIWWIVKEIDIQKKLVAKCLMGKFTDPYVLWSDVLLYMYSVSCLQGLKLTQTIVWASLCGDGIVLTDLTTAQWFIASWWLMFVAVIVHILAWYAGKSTIHICLTVHVTQHYGWIENIMSKLLRNNENLSCLIFSSHTNGHSIFLHLGPSLWAAEIFYWYFLS